MWWVSFAIAGTCEQYAESEPLALVKGAPFAEASGLAVSRTRPGVLYLHGDNGDEPLLLAVDHTGRILGEHRVVDATNEDWEDIAAAPCPDEGDCLYVGDIGDNDFGVPAEARTNITVYVVREPEEGDDKIRTIRRYVAVYPNGETFDAETLMVHPCTGRVHVVTKDEEGISTIFRMPFDPQETVTLEEVDRVQIDAPTKDGREITAGDWDLDGQRLALRGSDRVFEWITDPAQPNGHWDTEPTVLVGTTELQGEALAYGLDGEILTAGEGDPIPLSISACEDFRPFEGECVFPQTGRTCGCAHGTGAPWAGAALLLAALVRRIRSGR